MKLVNEIAGSLYQSDISNSLGEGDENQKWEVELGGWDG